MGDNLFDAIKPQAYHIKVFGFNYELYDSLIMLWIVMAIIIVLAYVLTRNLKTVPDGKQNAVEAFVDFINNFTKEKMPHHWKQFAPYFGTILLFLVVSNLMSVFSILPSTEDLIKMKFIPEHSLFKMFKFAPPTKDVNVTAPLALMSIILVIFSGLRYKKFSSWLKSFVDPLPIVLPFKILDYFTRPLSLCMRLFGNIVAAFTIMELIYATFPPFLPAAASLYFDLFDGTLQAYIFVFLTSLYVMEAIE